MWRLQECSRCFLYRGDRLRGNQSLGAEDHRSFLEPRRPAKLPPHVATPNSVDAIYAILYIQPWTPNRCSGSPARERTSAACRLRSAKNSAPTCAAFKTDSCPGIGSRCPPLVLASSRFAYVSKVPFA